MLYLHSATHALHGLSKALHGRNAGRTRAFHVTQPVASQENDRPWRGRRVDRTELVTKLCVSPGTRWSSATLESGSPFWGVYNHE